MSNVMDRPADFSVRRTVISEVPTSDGHYYDDANLFHHRVGRFTAAALNSPMLEGKDVAGLIGSVIITLGPLAAYSLGWGA